MLLTDTSSKWESALSVRELVPRGPLSSPSFYIPCLLHYLRGVVLGLLEPLIYGLVTGHSGREALAKVERPVRILRYVDLCGASVGNGFAGRVVRRRGID